MGVVSQLAPILQVSKLLQMRKSSPADVAAICELCTQLNALQVQKVLTMYCPSDEYEDRVPNTLIRLVAERGGANEVDPNLIMIDHTRFVCACGGHATGQFQPCVLWGVMRLGSSSHVSCGGGGHATGQFQPCVLPAIMCLVGGSRDQAVPAMSCGGHAIGQFQPCVLWGVMRLGSSGVTPPGSSSHVSCGGSCDWAVPAMCLVGVTPPGSSSHVSCGGSCDWVVPAMCLVGGHTTWQFQPCVL